jgi:hypothetical protein
MSPFDLTLGAKPPISQTFLQTFLPKQRVIIS